MLTSNGSHHWTITIQITSDTKTSDGANDGRKALPASFGMLQRIPGQVIATAPSNASSSNAQSAPEVLRQAGPRIARLRIQLELGGNMPASQNASISGVIAAARAVEDVDARARPKGAF
ncbi:hypothetical protein [Roseateles chitinivorans]|uniref:hypothetical protein n=1 Tax=Roseateles chitinivorans TaxID=2917965 RepID=UPI00130435B6|nr:hypothetical protein [Roseateles chitinivorans]